MVSDGCTASSAGKLETYKRQHTRDATDHDSSCLLGEFVPSVLSSERCRKCYLQYLLDSGRRFRNAQYSRSATVAREGAYQSRPRAIPRRREDFPGDSESVTSHVCRRLRG